MRIDLLVTIILAILATFFAWLFTYIYYRRANRNQNDAYLELKKQVEDQKRILDKLPTELVQKIYEDPRDKFDVKTLYKFILSKTVDKSKTGVDAFVGCPRCGSKNLNKRSELIDVDGVGTGIYMKIAECRNCGWREEEL